MGAASSFVEAVSDTVSDIGSVVVDTVSNVVDTAVDVWHDVSEPVVDTQLGRLALNVATGGQAAPLLAAYDISQGADPTKAITNAALSYAGSEFISPEISAVLGGDTAANIAADALVGGTKSAIQGGDFLTGAVAGGITSGIDEAKLAAAEDYLNSIEPGIAYDSITAPTEQDVINAYNLDVTSPEVVTYPIEIAPLPVGQELQSINDVITTISQPDVNVTPTETQTAGQYTSYTQNPDGTLTYTWDDGSTITINQNSDVVGYTPSTDTIYLPTDSTQTQNQPIDISGKLAALDLAKSISPYALAALIAKQTYDSVAQPTTGQNQYPIVPVPSDWGIPQYNMAFTPSAPIDFGTPELLRGTQWDQNRQPMSLTDVINTLSNGASYVMPQNINTSGIFQQQLPSVGVNDVIGSINGQPVSISSIISGIQGGQTNPS